MIAIREKPIERFVLHNISWGTFEKILDEIGETHHRVAYDNGDLEFMTISFGHEHLGTWIGRLIFLVALELQMSICTGGSTTLKQSLRKKGLEPNESFWIANESHMRGKKKWNILRDPPPDLAVEIEISRSVLDRLGIYAALKVPEVWRCDGEIFQVLILGANGKYKEKARSLAFPPLPMAEFARFVSRVDGDEEVKLTQEFLAWLRTDVVPKNGAGRKNGRT
jgi:Uma2 family endonuclease